MFVGSSTQFPDKGVHQELKRNLHANGNVLHLEHKMREKIDTPEGRKIYEKRIGTVEPVFGNIRSCKRMDRFTLRGKIKVGIQWKLYCLVHNIEKIMNFGRSYAMGEV